MKVRTEHLHIEDSGALTIGQSVAASAATSANIDLSAAAKFYPASCATPTGSLGTSSNLTGCMVYDSADNKIKVFTGSSWETVSSS